MAAAAREPDTSRNSGHDWENGYRVTHADGTVVVSEAHTPAPEPVSARFLSREERPVIADQLRTGRSLRGIAAMLGRDPSTMSREVRRNRGGLAVYRRFTAEQWARERRRRRHRLEIPADAQLGSWVAARPAEYWSSSQIAHALPAVLPRRRSRRVAHETICRAA